MGRSGATKRLRQTASLPGELMHVIFGKLDLTDKLNAGLVCKQWDQLLLAGTADARHWRVDYNLDTICTALKAAAAGPPAERIEAILERWFGNRAAAIKSVHVTATLSSDEEGMQRMELVREHLPVLVGCLSKYDNRLHLNFMERCPSLLSSSAVPSLLCPMVVTLSLTDLVEQFTATQFAAICELSSLEELTMSARGLGEGLQEVTEDVSKLVNLRVLDLYANYNIVEIPESISCLQNLELLCVEHCLIASLPVGLGTLANLTRLCVSSLEDIDLLPDGFNFLPNLQGLKSLTTLELVSCCLKTIPEQLIGLPALTSVDVSQNLFSAPEGWPWWPTTLSRLLTQLETLVMSECGIVSLPPYISVLRQLTKLDVGHNGLRSLPGELGSLTNLKELVVWSNRIPEPPVSVLSVLTALTSIHLGSNYRQTGVGPSSVGSPFTIPSSLLPILHPGLVYLDLRRDGMEGVEAQWDPTSLYHLGRAIAELADRRPVPTLLFRDPLPMGPV